MCALKAQFNKASCSWAVNAEENNKQTGSLYSVARCPFLFFFFLPCDTSLWPQSDQGLAMTAVLTANVRTAWHSSVSTLWRAVDCLMWATDTHRIRIKIQITATRYINVFIIMHKPGSRHFTRCHHSTGHQQGRLMLRCLAGGDRVYLPRAGIWNLITGVPGEESQPQMSPSRTPSRLYSTNGKEFRSSGLRQVIRRPQTRTLSLKDLFFRLRKEKWNERRRWEEASEERWRRRRGRSRKRLAMKNAYLK